MNDRNDVQPLSLLLFSELACEVEPSSYDDETDLNDLEIEAANSPVKNNKEN